MIKVMQVLTDTNIGGAGIWLINFLKAYDRGRLDVFVVLPSSSLLMDKIRSLGVRVIEADSIKDISFSVKAVKELKRIIKTEKPDIVHTHASLSARIAAKLSFVKVVHTRHCIEGKKRFPKNIIYSFVNNFLSDSVIGVSKAVRDNLICDGIKEKKLHLVYNGISPVDCFSQEERLKAKKRFGIPENAKTVGLVARLEAVKNPLLFVSAAKIVLKTYPDTYFLLVGEGSLRSEVTAAMKPIEKNITLTGYISDIENAYNAMDILTLTSDSEALSISILEGQSTGLAVISTSSGGPAEIIENNKNGIIIPINDEKALADAIIYLLENTDKKQEFGENGKKLVLEKFTADNMARKIEKVYLLTLRKE